jgi:hypothetical protein
MLFEAIHKSLNILFVVEPIFLVLLDLILGLTKLFVEFLDILLRMHHLTVVGKLFKIFSDCLIEFAGFSDQHFLDGKEVPVLANGLEEIVEEIIEFNTQVVPNKDDVVTKLHLVH